MLNTLARNLNSEINELRTFNNQVGRLHSHNVSLDHDSSARDLLPTSQHMHAHGVPV